MSSLLAFRKRIWNLLASENLESDPNTVEVATTSEEYFRGTKRKLSFSPEVDLETTFKRLKLENTDFKQEPVDEDYPMIESTEVDDQMPARADYDGPQEAKQRSSKSASVRPSRSPKQEVEDYESDEEFVEYAIDQDKEDLFEEYKVEAIEHVTAEDEGFEGWSQQEISFFNSLNDRGAVPMLWSYWKIDFPTLPESMFTSLKEDAVIKNLKGHALAGARALNALIEAGSFARERQQRNQNAAQLLAKAINNYIKWSFRDAKLDKDHYIPLIVVNFAYKNENLDTTDARTQKRVRKLTDQYRQLWEEAEPKFQSPPPTIFHIFIAKTVMGFGSFDTSAGQPEFRNLFFTDWKHRGYDLWNAMAIALLVHQTRAWLIEVDPRKRHGIKPPEPDPDL